MSSNNWWNKKLGANGPVPNVPPVSTPPSTVYRPPVQQPNVQVNYDPQQDQLVSKAVSSRQDDRCPNCMSGNYFAPQGTQRMRCYDCGYPVIQAGSGAGMPSGSSGPTVAAKQPAKGSGFNPNIIVDRIG